MGDEPTEIERRIRSAWDAKDFDTAATLTVEAYTDEILTFLGARLRSSSDAQEAFSMFAEDLWVGLPNFGWRCAMRTWVHALARNAGNRYATSPHNRRDRNLTLAK